MPRRKTYEDEPLFKAQAERPTPGRRLKKAPTERLWTGNKALLIERYLYYFVLITKHGTYVDGFAGPQDLEKLEAWAARLVVESEPRRLRHIYLFEIDAKKIRLLEQLRDAQPDRDVRVYGADFNVEVRQILRSDVLKQTEATFCLLDQHTFECRWSTLEKLAAYKADGLKIELFYFFAHGWLDRAIAATTTEEGRERLDSWWGSDAWQVLRSMRGLPRARLLARRFEQELGYRTAVPYAIYARNRAAGRVMYYMIHASDHPEAPKLMDRAYANAVLPKEPVDQLVMELGPG